MGRKDRNGSMAHLSTVPSWGLRSAYESKPLSRVETWEKVRDHYFIQLTAMVADVQAAA